MPRYRFTLFLPSFWLLTTPCPHGVPGVLIARPLFNHVATVFPAATVLRFFAFHRRHLQFGFPSFFPFACKAKHNPTTFSLFLTLIGTQMLFWSSRHFYFDRVITFRKGSISLSLCASCCGNGVRVSCLPLDPLYWCISCELTHSCLEKFLAS